MTVDLDRINLVGMSLGALCLSHGLSVCVSLSLCLSLFHTRAHTHTHTHTHKAGMRSDRLTSYGRRNETFKPCLQEEASRSRSLQSLPQWSLPGLRLATRPNRLTLPSQCGVDEA